MIKMCDGDLWCYSKLGSAFLPVGLKNSPVGQNGFTNRFADIKMEIVEV